MSETAELETLHKKTDELETQLSSQQQKRKTLEDDVKALEEKIQTQLEQKIKSEDQALETLESKRKDLEKRLAALQENQAPQSVEEPTIVAETPQPVQEQPIEVTAEANVDNQWPNEEPREKRQDKKRSRWM